MKEKAKNYIDLSFPPCCGIDIATILNAMIISNLDILCALPTWTDCFGYAENL